MAPTTKKRTTIASWVPPTLADEIRLRAENERRSISSVIRFALEDSLRAGTPPDNERTG